MAGKPPFEMPDMPYAGDITCAEAWEALVDNPEAVLVDVRTQIEWTLIGKPDLAYVRVSNEDQKKAIFIGLGNPQP